MTRVLPYLVALLALAGCSIPERDQPRPAARPSARPAPASRPVAVPVPTAAETAACHADLRALGVRFNILADRRFAGECSALGSVQLLDIGVPVTNLGAMRCPLARTFAQWIRNGAMPAAREILGSELVRVESFGTYSCRTIAGSSRMSEHSVANAVDIAAFGLADGRRISIAGNWNDSDPEVRRFLRTVHASACRRFRTVLGPDYNAAHADHIHADMGRGPFCR